MDETTSLARRAIGRRLFVWLPVMGWATLIFALSAQPNLVLLPDPGFDIVVRKLGHMGEFAILAMLLWRAPVGMAWSPPWFWTLALAVGYAVTDELHQAFVAGRHPSVMDVAIDATGALIALMAVGVIRSRRS